MSVNVGQSDIEFVIRRSRTIESLLVELYGATGRGLHEKTDSVVEQLSAPLIKRLRLIATVRNKILHDANYERVENPDSFIRACDLAEDELRQLKNEIPTLNYASAALTCLDTNTQPHGSTWVDGAGRAICGCGVAVGCMLKEIVRLIPPAFAILLLSLEAMIDFFKAPWKTDGYGDESGTVTLIKVFIVYYCLLIGFLSGMVFPVALACGIYRYTKSSNTSI